MQCKLKRVTIPGVLWDFDTLLMRAVCGLLSVEDWQNFLKMNIYLPHDPATVLKDMYEEIHGSIIHDSPQLNTTREQGQIVIYSYYRALTRNEL